MLRWCGYLVHIRWHTSSNAGSTVVCTDSEHCSTSYGVVNTRTSSDCFSTYYRADAASNRRTDAGLYCAAGDCCGNYNRTHAASNNRSTNAGLHCTAGDSFGNYHRADASSNNRSACADLHCAAGHIADPSPADIVFDCRSGAC